MPRILIIDDDRMVRDATQILLRAKGYDVVAAADGKSGIEAATSSQFDVVIVDLFMPDLDGLQVIGAIRNANPRVHMIAASGFMFGDKDTPSMPNFATMAAEVGAEAALYKPFRPDKLLQTITDVLGSAA